MPRFLITHPLASRSVIRYLVAALIPVVLLGCANLDIATEEARATKLRTAGHWGTIANDVAGKLVQALGTEDRPYLIEAADRHSLFDDSIRTLLSSALVARRAQVIVDAGAIPATSRTPWVVSLDTVVIPHGAASDTGKDSPSPGSFTVLGGGVYLASRALGAGGAAIGDPISMIGSGLLADAALLVPPKRPSTELLLTTAVSRAGTYRFRRSDIYFIEDDDFAQYVPKPAPANGSHANDAMLTVLYDPIHETVSDALARADRHCARNGGRAVIAQRSRETSRDHDASFTCIYW